MEKTQKDMRRKGERSKKGTDIRNKGRWKEENVRKTTAHGGGKY
jgi:hypothetical protein